MDGAQLFARVARDLAEQADHSRAVQRLTELAIQLVGCDVAAVWEKVPTGWLALRAATDSVLGQALDSILTGVDEGIAHEALATRSTVVMQDLATEQRWPKYRAAVLERGLPFRSAVVYSLDVADTDLGALALYANKPGFFSEEFLLDTGGVLADHAAIAFEAAAASHRAGHLALALDSNRRIGMAIGILMATHKLTDQAAFDMLRLASQRNHLKLREVAEQVVLTGAIPAWPAERRRPTQR